MASSGGFGLAQLQALAAEQNPIVGYFDPLGLSEDMFFEETNEATIGFLRHAEIKHGRVAMAAFVGYCIQANGIHFPWTPYPGFEEGLSPPEQWAAIPAAGKWQFLVFIGILEALGESFAPGEHYMAGGRPGVFPSLKEPNEEMLSKGVYPFHGFPLDLYDPFGTFANRSPEDKERGLRVEVNNGRLAMLGIFSIISEATVPGSVPALKDMIPPYDGNVMIPFSGDFSIFS